MSFKEGKEADLKRGGGRGRGTGGRASGGGRGKGDGSGGAKDAEARQNSGARGRNSGDAQQQLPPADAGTNGTAQQERPSAWGEGSIHEKHRGQHHKDDGRDGGKRGGDREPRTWRGGGGGAAAAANGGDHRREKPRSEERSAWGSAPDAYDNRKPPRTRDEHLPAGGRKGGGGGEGARAVESNYDYKYDYKPPTRGRERGHGSHRGDERDYQQQQQGGGQPQEPPPTRITDKDAPPPPPLAAPRKGGKGDRNLSDRPPPRSTPAHDQWEPTREAPPATRPDLPAKADLRRQNQNQNQGERDPSGRSIGSLRQGVPRERIVDKGPVVPQDVCLSYNVVDELVEKTITRVLDEGFWWPHDLVPGRAMQYFGWQYDEDKKLAHSVTVPVPQFLRERVLRPLQSIPATLSTFPLGVEPDHVLAMEQDWGKSDANLSFEPLQCPNAFVSDMAFVVLNNSCTFSFSSPDKDSKPIEVSVPRRTAVVFRGSSSQLNKRLIRRETDDAERTVIVAFRLLSDTAKQVRLEGHWASPNKLGWTNDKLQRHSNMIQEMKNRCNMYKLKERQEEEERIQKEEEEAKLVEMRRELEARAEATRREEAQRVEEEARRRERHEVETRQREIREAEQRERDRELDMQRQRDHELDQQRQLVERERAERDRQAQLQQQQQQQQQHPHKQQQQQQAPPQDDQRLPPPGPHGPPGAPGHPPHHAGQGPPMQQQGQARQQLGSTQPPGLRKEDGYDRIPSPPAADDEPSKPFNLFDSVGKDAAGPSTAFAPSGQRPHAPPQQQHPHPLSSQYGLSRDLFESSQPGHDRYGSVSPVAPHAPDGFSRDRPPPPQAQPQHARGEYGGEYPSHAAIKPTAPPPSHAPGPGSAPGPSNASSTVDQGYGLWTSSQYYGSGGYQGGSGAGAPSQRMMGPGSHGPPGPPGPPPPSGGQSQGPSHEGPGGLQGPFFDSLGGSQERGREFWGQQFAGLNVNAKPFQPPPEGGGSTMREAPGHGQQSHQPPGHGPLSYLGQSRPQEHSHGSSGPGQAHPQQQPQHPLSRQPYSQQGMYGQQQPPSQHMMQSSMSRPQQPSYAFQANVSNVPSNASIGSGSLSSSQNMQVCYRHWDPYFSPGAGC
ncbi:hypothetical protein DIPPA_01469 [Diplonema papillatum]|nr:hypothetical protein DIPPA_01469 [Diplonema papillatum]